MGIQFTNTEIQYEKLYFELRNEIRDLRKFKAREIRNCKRSILNTRNFSFYEMIGELTETMRAS